MRLACVGTRSKFTSVPAPREPEPAAQTTLYIVVVGTDGYETVVSEGEVDPGFGNAPILLGYAEDGVVLSLVPYNFAEFKGPAQLVVPTDTHGGRYANPSAESRSPTGCSKLAASLSRHMSVARRCA